MSAKSSFLKETTGLLESNKEIKSYIHQQILDFEPFITPETLILVVARDPHHLEEDIEVAEPTSVFTQKQAPLAHRIVIILKENDSSIEAEALHDDIFEAIKLAKENLVGQLIAIQSEIESSQDRLLAIQQASNSNQIH